MVCESCMGYTTRWRTCHCNCDIWRRWSNWVVREYSFPSFWWSVTWEGTWNSNDYGRVGMPMEASRSWCHNGAACNWK